MVDAILIKFILQNINMYIRQRQQAIKHFLPQSAPCPVLDPMSAAGVPLSTSGEDSCFWLTLCGAMHSHFEKHIQILIYPWKTDIL